MMSEEDIIPGNIYLYRAKDKYIPVFITAIMEAHADGIGDYKYARYYFLTEPDNVFEKVIDILVYRLRRIDEG